MSRDLLNIAITVQTLKQAFDERGISAEFVHEYGGFVADCTYKTDVYPDELEFTVDVFPDGFVNINFYFDFLDINEQTLRLVNDFNHNVIGFKASLRDDGCLIVSSEMFVLTQDGVELYIKKVLENIIAKDAVDAVRYLMPLIKLSHKEAATQSIQYFKRIDICVYSDRKDFNFCHTNCDFIPIITPEFYLGQIICILVHLRKNIFL